LPFGDIARAYLLPEGNAAGVAPEDGSAAGSG
jgi:hypothetical protein